MGEMSLSLPTALVRRLLVALALSACLIGLAWAKAQPAAAGAQTLDLRVSVAQAPGSGATLKYRGTFTGTPIGRGKVSLVTRLSGSGGATVTYVMTHEPRQLQRLGRRHADLPRLDRRLPRQGEHHQGHRRLPAPALQRPDHLRAGRPDLREHLAAPQRPDLLLSPRCALRAPRGACGGLNSITEGREAAGGSGARRRPQWCAPWCTKRACFVTVFGDAQGGGALLPATMAA